MTFFARSIAASIHRFSSATGTRLRPSLNPGGGFTDGQPGAARAIKVDVCLHVTDKSTRRTLYHPVCGTGRR